MDAPAVAVTRDGRKFAFAWMDQRTGDNDRQVYWSVMKGGANEKESVLAEKPKGIKGHPALAYDAQGKLHAAWEDLRLGTQRIHYRTLTGNDTAISPEKVKASFPVVACGKVVGIAFELGEDVAFTTIAK